MQVTESFWLGIWTGASRYIHCDCLRQDQTLAAIFLGHGASAPCLAQPDQEHLEQPSRQREQDAGVEAFCLQRFCATEASFIFIMVAYNLMSLFRTLGSKVKTKPPWRSCDLMALQ